jgi:hypothetical protein
MALFSYPLLYIFCGLINRNAIWLTISRFSSGEFAINNTSMYVVLTNLFIYQNSIRDMLPANLSKAAWLMLVIVVVAIASWEWYLRNNGYDANFDDDPALWTHSRHRVYQSPSQSTVFIGSSRIKFDLDIPTWEQLTQQTAVQLSCVGSTPIPFLQNLADDENFKGRLVVDVTEGLFFSTAPPNYRRPNENLKFYKERTPAQWAGFYVNRLLESQFVFLDKERLSLSAYADYIPLANRPGVFQFPAFPHGFGRVKFNRQEYMTPQLVSDTAQANIVKNIWAMIGRMGKEPPTSGKKLDSILNIVKMATNKIKSRGGEVIFLRTPSSGSFKAKEEAFYPRQQYWEKILAVTNCPGIYYQDYPAIAHFVCPEESHLSMADAKIFTAQLVKILEQEHGWRFAKAAEK